MTPLSAHDRIRSMSVALKRTTLISVFLTSFLTPFMGSAVNLAVPAIGAEFQARPLTLAWVVTSYLLSSAAFLLPFGRLADVTGRRRVYLWGTALFAVTTLLCASASSIRMLILLRVLQGIAASMVFSTGTALLASVYPSHQRGRALGATVAATYVGLSLGPVLGGVMTQNLGWRSIFLTTGPVAFGVLIFTALYLKEEWTGARGETFDLAGSAMYAVGLVACLYGLSSISTSAGGRYFLFAGLLLAGLLVLRESRLQFPIIPARLFRTNVTFAMSNLAALINYSATFAVGFLMSLYLQLVLGYSPQTAGLILISQPVMMALFSPLAGALSDRVEARVVASCGMALSTIGLFIFTFLTANGPTWLILANLALLGLGFALFSSPNTNAIMGAVDKRLYGVASSSLATMRVVGQAVSMSIVTLLLSVYVGQAHQLSASPDGLVTSMRAAFAGFTVISFGGIFASLARGNMGHAGRSD